MNTNGAAESTPQPSLSSYMSEMELSLGVSNAPRRVHHTVGTDVSVPDGVGNASYYGLEMSLSSAVEHEMVAPRYDEPPTTVSMSMRPQTMAIQQHQGQLEPQASQVSPSWMRAGGALAPKEPQVQERREFYDHQAVGSLGHVFSMNASAPPKHVDHRRRDVYHIPTEQRMAVAKKAAAAVSASVRESLGVSRLEVDQPLCPGCVSILMYDMFQELARREAWSFENIDVTNMGRELGEVFAGRMDAEELR